MRDKKSMVTKAEIGICWVRERLFELWSQNVAPASKGLGMLEAAMAMAAVRGNMLVVKRMIALGADPAAKDFLAYRMAALAGDVDGMTSIEAIGSPTEYALGDALLWARANDRVDAIDHLTARIAALVPRTSS